MAESCAKCGDRMRVRQYSFWAARSAEAQNDAFSNVETTVYRGLSEFSGSVCDSCTTRRCSHEIRHSATIALIGAALMAGLWLACQQWGGMEPFSWAALLLWVLLAAASLFTLVLTIGLLINVASFAGIGDMRVHAVAILIECRSPELRQRGYHHFYQNRPEAKSI